MTATVTVRCISCGAKREIRPYEVPEGEMPECHMEGCLSIMIAERATAK